MILAILRDAFTSHRARLWYAAAAAAVGAVLLKELSQLLAAFQPGADTGQAYSAGVLTRPRFRPVSGADDIQAAWAVWTGSPETRDLGARLVVWHTLIDLLVFVPGYCALAYALLRRVGTATRPALTVVAAVAITDAAETLATLIVLPGLDRPGLSWVIGVLSDLKWVAVLFAGLVLLFRWLRPDGGTDAGSAGRRLRARWRGAGADEDQPGPLLRLRVQVLLVSAFAALVALPAGGPLDQVPDVLRSHVEDPGATLVLSVVALGVFMAAVVVSGWRSSLLDLTAAGPRRAPLSTWALLGLALAVAAASAILVTAVGGFVLPSLSLAIVLAAVALVPLVGAGLARWSLATPVPAPDPDDPEQVPTGTDREALCAWLGALAGAVALAGSIGLVRAAFRPALVSGDLRFWLAAGLLLAFLGSPAVHSLAVSGWVTPALIGGLGRVAPAVAAVALLVIALWPRQAGPGLGSTGVVAVVFAALALLLGQVQRHIERTRPWDAVRWLRLGRRTPLVGLVLVAWLLASLWDTEGGYHDARLLAEPHRATYQDLGTAWDTWRAADSCTVGTGDQRVRPLLLVAAPGGGIRAAYWTASALDRIAAACPGSVFAVSGVSGGSVGTMAWAYGPAAGSAVPGRDLVTAIAGDRALAAGVAGMLTRDLPRSLLALRGGMADRAGVTEQSWESSMQGTTGGAGRPDVRFDQLRAPAGPAPVLVLNGASATDGCRVLMSNVDSLATPTDRSCQDLPADGQVGPTVSAAVTGTDGLRTGKPQLAGDCPDGTASLRATTAALLSARFPLVSPSGALRRCVAGKVAPTYVLDGGYYENSGLLTLLQLWEGVEPAVERHNATAGAVRVQPWVVVLDNHYRGRAAPAPVKRTPELRMPLVGNGNAKQTISTAALEQVAASEMGGCFRHVAPDAKPDVAAPLGWVLSAITRRQLDEQLPAALGQPDPAVPPDWLGSPTCPR